MLLFIDEEQTEPTVTYICVYLIKGTLDNVLFYKL